MTPAQIRNTLLWIDGETRDEHTRHARVLARLAVSRERIQARCAHDPEDVPDASGGFDGYQRCQVCGKEGKRL